MCCVLFRLPLLMDFCPDIQANVAGGRAGLFVSPAAFHDGFPELDPRPTANGGTVPLLEVDHAVG